MHLIVTTPFGDYGRGDRIEDAEEVARVQAEHPAHVVAVAPTAEPKPEKVKKA